MPLSLVGLKILGIFVVFFCGLFGPTCPVIFAYFAQTAKDQRRVQRIIKVMTCLSVGIILATALIHMLNEGIHQIAESGVSPFAEKKSQDKAPSSINCSTSTTTTTTTEGNNSGSGGGGDDEEDEEEDEPYPYGMIFALAAIGVTYIFSTELNWYGMKKLKELEGVGCDEEEEQRQASLIKLYLLEVGVAIHSVIIGVAFGISKSYTSATTLFVVLCVHQFFEGLAIGSLCVMAHINVRHALGFIGSFALTTPLGIVIGVSVAGDADLLTQGILGCVAAGILLQMALCEMLPAVLGSHAHHAHGPMPLAEIAEKMNGNNNNNNHSHQHHHGHSHGDDHHHHHDRHHQNNNKNEEQEILQQGYGSVVVRNSKTRRSNNQEDESQNGENMRTSRNCEGENDDEDRQMVRGSNVVSVVDARGSRKSLLVGKGALRVSRSMRRKSVEHDDEHNNDSANKFIDSQVLHDSENIRTSNAVSDYVDDHEEDESIWFRIVCYFAFFVGISIQAVLGIWA